MQQICRTLSDRNRGDEDLMEILDELQELLSLHRNPYNFCKSGGMAEILSLIFSHPKSAVRKKACIVMSDVTGNNEEVQKFAQRTGALNLTQLIEKEQDFDVKMAMFAALASVLKAKNLQSKRIFIKDYNGLCFLDRLVCQNMDSKLQVRVLSLMNDLMKYDDSIFGLELNGDKFHVRRYFSQNEMLL